MKDNNVIDFNLISEENNGISEEMLQAYMDAADIDTPDLWERIDEGFLPEYENYSKEQVKQEKTKKQIKKKYFVMAAAVVLVVLIAVPVMLGGRNKSEDNVLGDAADMIFGPIGENAISPDDIGDVKSEDVMEEMSQESATEAFDGENNLMTGNDTQSVDSTQKQDTEQEKVMIMVDGQLYSFTGRVVALSSEESIEIIGSIIEVLDFDETPDADGQANFGNVGDRYGYYKDMLAVSYEQGWKLFEKNN